MMEIESKKNQKLIFFDKDSLSGPLSEHSKQIERLADNDPENPGIF